MRPVRLERTTCGLGNRRSILLSYGRESPNDCSIILDHWKARIAVRWPIMTQEPSVVNRWSALLADFLPGYFAQTPALSALDGQCAIVLHGSTTLGVDDAVSDLDLWVLVPDAALQAAESIAGTRFFSFELAGKKGHLNLEAAGDALAQVDRCDLERIAELRRCRVLADGCGLACEVVSRANQPMAEAVRRTWFRYHYVEMRGFHRSCDGPIERGDALALLQALVPTLNHALRAALVLDSQPYPYIKWLGHAAAQTPTGRLIIPLVDNIVKLLAQDALHHPGPEAGHPLGAKLREIRRVLIDSARVGGIDEPWLERWWVYMTQAAKGISSVTW